jgi:hypothetical protein
MHSYVPVHGRRCHFCIGRFLAIFLHRLAELVRYVYLNNISLKLILLLIIIIDTFIRKISIRLLCKFIIIYDDICQINIKQQSAAGRQYHV